MSWRYPDEAELAEQNRIDLDIAKAFMDDWGKPRISPRGRCFVVNHEGKKERFSPTRRSHDATDVLDRITSELDYTFRLSQNWDHLGPDGPQTRFEIITLEGKGLWGEQQVVAWGVSTEEGTRDSIHESMVMAIHDFVERGLHQ